MNIGAIKDRQILYLNARKDAKWAQQLPSSNWVLFTISDEENKALVDKVTNTCLNRNVSYVCCAGETGDYVEDCFDWAIVFKELANSGDFKLEDTIVTTAHRNFSEGFWFASTTANTDPEPINTVVCLDLTNKGVQQHLVRLIDQINNGWLPSDEEFEDPEYD